jgi:AraC-like DNA-binding protein
MRPPETRPPPFKPEVRARGHALVSPLVVAAFAELGIGVSLIDGRGWHDVQVARSIHGFELEHGVEHQRYEYNDRCLAEAARTRAPIVGHHAGFCDLFVPLGVRAPVRHALVAGPFALAWPTSSEILDRWRWLTGRQGRMSDPEFAHYVAMVLSIPVFEGAAANTFRQLVECLAVLMVGEGDAEAVFAKVVAMRASLADTAFPLRMWEAARAMVDQRTEHIWASPANTPHLAALGAERVPEHAIVGLVSSRRDEADALDELLRRSALQRACVGLARTLGNVLCGRVGDHGVVFLVPAQRSERKSRALLLRVGARANDLARRYGLSLHLGVGASGPSASLSARYQASLSAAERALSTGVPVVDTRADEERPEGLLRDLRRQLAGQVGQRPGDLAARFDRYLEAVAAHTGYRTGAMRAHLDAGFERLTDPLLTAGALGEKSFADMWKTLERSSEAAATAAELLSAYRRAVVDVEAALVDPSHAQQERSLRRAVSFVREHATERLTLAAVARVGGFAPNYFARLFKERERVTFGTYLRNLRLERATQMLARTSLTIARVGQLSGFPSKYHFHRLFRRVVGVTPAAYRERNR